MSKTSIIAHQAYAHFVAIREDYLLLTQNAPDMHAAALILDCFEFWTNGKLANYGGNFDKAWVYKSIDDMQTDLYMLHGRNKILDNLQWLTDTAYLERRNNPENGWDKTYQYRLNYRLINNDLMLLWAENADSLELNHRESEIDSFDSLESNHRKSETKPAIPKKTTKKTSIENNKEIKPRFFAALKHHEQVYSDGKRLDPMILQGEYNDLFYAWLEALEAAGMPRGNDYKALWERERDGAVSLAKQRVTPDELKRYVNEDLLADKKGGNWYRVNAKIPKLETAATHIGAWLKQETADSTYSESGNETVAPPLKRMFTDEQVQSVRGSRNGKTEQK